MIYFNYIGFIKPISTNVMSFGSVYIRMLKI